MEKSDYSISQLFGENVQKCRKKANLTQIELSEKMGISQKHLSEIETGIKFPSSNVIEKFVQVLDVSPAVLFGGSDISDITRKITVSVLNNITPLIEDIKRELNEIKKMNKKINIAVTCDDENVI